MLTVSRDQNGFPALLKEIHNPPPTISYRGELAALVRPCVAIVGTRRATGNGLAIARSFAKELAAAGATIVSGLALGVDTAAHRGALEGKGKTVAVLGNGIDWVYPRQNAALAEEIIKTGGAVISEYPAGEPSYPANFLARNRIVSGLSLGVIVIEAPERSGSLVTANFALEQNREVFVVPGPVNSENYAGSHSLLRAGARVVTKPAEVLEDLGLLEAAAAQKTLSPILNLTGEQKIIFEALKNSGEPVNADRIQNLTDLGITDINRGLTYLLLKGVIREELGFYQIASF